MGAKQEKGPQAPLCESAEYYALVDGGDVVIKRIEDDVLVGKVPIAGEEAALANFIAHAVSVARARRAAEPGD